ncbi:MAG: riboflavin biosynthesis protein RibF [Armatimonadota bacterium]
MTRVQWTPELTLPRRPRVVALGAFDGVHLGHARTIRAMREVARERSAEAAVLTFDPSPREFDDGVRRPGRRLTPLDEQMYYLRKLGVDLVVLFEFPGRIQRVGPEDFVRRILVGQLNTVHVTASETHRFGHKGAGDLALLRRLGEELGYGVQTVSPLLIGGARVSSTRIRDLLAQGKVHEAGALLGRPYAVYAPVVSGRGLGSRLGYPTANLNIPPEKILPRDGVYAGVCGQVHADNYEALEQPRAAAINVGLAPTVRGDQRLVEVHLVGEQCDLLGSSLKVAFLRWLRGEQRFRTTAHLAAQIGRDAERAAAAADELEAPDLHTFEGFCAHDYVIRRGSLGLTRQSGNVSG